MRPPPATCAAPCSTARRARTRERSRVAQHTSAERARGVSAVVVHGIGALCTCDPLVGEAPGVVHDAALVARDGVIVYAGPESGLDRARIPSGALEIQARGAAVLPGFVDAH